MAEEQHDRDESTAPGAEESVVTSDEVVVEAELIEPEAEPVVVAAGEDPAVAANESLAAAAAAAAAVDPDAVPASEPPVDWQPVPAATGPQPQYVVVEAPQAPLSRGNRGIGALLALAGAVIYGGAMVGVAYLLETLAGRPGVGFLQDWHFYLPIGIFAVAFVLLVVLVNRAGWWSYILGSLVVGVLVYLGTAGGAVLIEGWTGQSARTSFAGSLLAPFVILAGILGREVAVWWGSLIAYRGRRVTARNRAEREAFDRDMAEFRARYGG